jgi:hypothetical protein
MSRAQEMAASIETMIKSLDVEGVRAMIAQGHRVSAETILSLLNMGPQGEAGLQILEMLLAAYTKPLLHEDRLVQALFKWQDHQAQVRALCMLLEKGYIPGDEEICSAMQNQVPFEFLELLLESGFVQSIDDPYRNLAVQNIFKYNLLNLKEFFEMVARHVQYAHINELISFFKCLGKKYAKSSLLQWNMFKALSAEKKLKNHLPLPPHSLKRKAEQPAEMDLDRYTWEQLAERIKQYRKYIERDTYWKRVLDDRVKNAAQKFDSLAYKEAVLARKPWAEKIENLEAEVKQMEERLDEMYNNANARVEELEAVMAEDEDELDKVNGREYPHEFERYWKNCASSERELKEAKELRDEIGRVLGF